MLFAKSAILVHFKSVGVVFLVFHCVVVALLALCAGEGNFHSHDGTSRFTEYFRFLFLSKKQLSLPHAKRFFAHKKSSFSLGKKVFTKKKTFRGRMIISQSTPKVKHFFI